jgi:hypothetical protein
MTTAAIAFVVALTIGSFQFPYMLSSRYRAVKTLRGSIHIS